MSIVKNYFRNQVKSILADELRDLRSDVSYRLRALEDRAKVNSHQLILPGHILDGYEFLENTPSAGMVSWNDCHIVYKGTTYPITDGLTDQKYIYWTKDTNNDTFRTHFNKPELGIDDVLVGINEGGKIHLLIQTGKFVHGSAIVEESISNDEIAANANIQAAKIGDLPASKITTGEFNANRIPTLDANKIGSGELNEARIPSLSASKIGSGTFHADRIPTLQIAKVDGLQAELDEKLSSADIGDIEQDISSLESARDTLMDRTQKFGSDGEVISDGASIGLGALSDLNTVGTAEIQNNAVTNAKVPNGVLSAQKLNVSQHFIF